MAHESRGGSMIDLASAPFSGLASPRSSSFARSPSTFSLASPVDWLGPPIWSGGSPNPPPSGALAGSTTADELVDRALNRTAVVQVVARIRPLLDAERARGDAQVLRLAREFNNEYRVLEAVVARSNERETVRRFTFDRVAPPELSQREFFDMSGVKELMDAAFAGVNVSVFAYGQTGSGKTFSMSGHEERMSIDGESSSASSDLHMGIIPRAVAHLFSLISAQSPRSTTSIRACYAEIYNEQVYDLLNLTGESLPLRYAPHAGAFFAQGQVLVACDSPDEVMSVVAEGHRNRTVGSHALNLDSSRSHSLFTLLIERNAHDTDGSGPVRSKSKIMFVDLAGSERLKDSRSEGATQLESRQINKSLFVLAKVIAALSDRSRLAGPRAIAPGSLGGLSKGGSTPSSTTPFIGRGRQDSGGDASSVVGSGGGPGGAASSGGASANDDAHIPYRDSKLTRLLRDSLGGTALTVMIACVSPSEAYLEESLATLHYATRASRIENVPIVHMDTKDALILTLKRENKAARGENATLRAKFGLPAEGPLTELLQGMPLMVPVDTVLVQQRLIAPTRESTTQTEPLHPSALLPRLPTYFKPEPAADAPGKGRPVGRQRSRLTNGGSSAARALALSASAAAAATAAAEAQDELVTSSGSRIKLVYEDKDNNGGSGLFTLPPPAVVSHVADRISDRAGKQVVLDLQQSEIAALTEERAALQAKHAAAKARIAVLGSTIEEHKGTIERLAAQLDAARRGQREAERSAAAILSNAAAAGLVGPQGGEQLPRPPSLQQQQQQQQCATQQQGPQSHEPGGAHHDAILAATQAHTASLLMAQLGGGGGGGGVGADYPPYAGGGGGAGGEGVGAAYGASHTTTFGGGGVGGTSLHAQELAAQLRNHNEAMVAHAHAQLQQQQQQQQPHGGSGGGGGSVSSWGSPSSSRIAGSGSRAALGLSPSVQGGR